MASVVAALAALADRHRAHMMAAALAVLVVMPL
jgi:hypothetical protein